MPRPEEPAPQHSGETTPLRVPFGRGPKDRAFTHEQPQPATHPRGRNQQKPQNQHRHDNRKHSGKGKR
jgi:hypothetical protein